MTEATDTPVANPMMPGKRGGQLRRGGGRKPDARKATAVQAIRDGLPGAVKALLSQSANGEGWAIKLVLEYGLGKPVDKVEISGPEGGPLEHSLPLTDAERRILRDARLALDAEPDAEADT